MDKHAMKCLSLLAGAALLAGCTEQRLPAAPAPQQASTQKVAVPAPATVAKVSKETLMHAVFGEQYRPASKDALARLPMLRWPDRIRYYDVKPLASGVLNTGVAVLLAQSDYAQQNTEDDNEVIEDEALLSVYLLRQADGKWQVIQRRDHFMIRGENSGRGSILFPMLNETKQGLAIVSSLAMDGCPSETLHLIDVDHDPVRLIPGGLPTGWTSGPQCDNEDSGPSAATSSTWYLAPPKKPGAAYHDVVVTSITTQYDQDDKPIATGKKFSTRYAYDGKRYQKVSGAGPAPY